MTSWRDMAYAGTSVDPAKVEPEKPLTLETLRRAHALVCLGELDHFLDLLGLDVTAGDVLEALREAALARRTDANEITRLDELLELTRRQA